MTVDLLVVYLVVSKADLLVVSRVDLLVVYLVVLLVDLMVV